MAHVLQVLEPVVSPDPARNIFRFFDLPMEMREMVYSNLVNTTTIKHALVRPPPFQQLTGISFKYLWLPHLLLVDKKFRKEYFEHICSQHLRCYYYINSAPAAEVFICDQAATACLSKVRTLVVCSIFYKDLLRDTSGIDEGHTSTIDDQLPKLINLLPRVKSVQERVFIETSTVDGVYLQGGGEIFREFHPSNTRFKTALVNHSISRDVKYECWLLFQDFLSFDLATREPDWNNMMTYVARWKTGEEKQEHLWHDFALETDSVDARAIDASQAIVYSPRKRA